MNRNILIPVFVALIVFGFYTRYRYKNHKWLDGSDLTSRKQSITESLIALGSFVAAMALMYLWTFL